jgi:hypothetical protein
MVDGELSALAGFNFHQPTNAECKIARRRFLTRIRAVLQDQSRRNKADAKSVTHNHAHSGLRCQTCGQLLCWCECLNNDEQLARSSRAGEPSAVYMESQIPFLVEVCMLLLDIGFDPGKQLIDLLDEDICLDV